MKAIFYNDFKNAYIPEILNEIYKDKIYDQFFYGKKDQIVLDVGANIGLFSLYAYNFAKTVYAVEPSKQHLGVLNKMIDFNDVDDKIIIVPKALSHEDGKAKFYQSENETMFSLKDAVKDEREAEEVETIRLDSLMKELKLDHIDFLKLDVEGSESEIVGGEGFEKVADKIKAMVVEYHQWSAFNPSQMYNTLKDYGFEVFQIPCDAVLYGAVRK